MTTTTPRKKNQHIISTGRFMMKHEFDAVERMIKVDPSAVENVIAFVRDPLSRFYSGYDEAYARTAPWKKMQNPYYIDPAAAADDDDEKFNNKPHPFPYLFENLHSNRDYEDVYCPPSTRSNRRECIFVESGENGTLASRLERFVRDYDGRSPFDVHLALQVPMLSDARSGGSLHVTELYNTTNSERDWNAIAERYLGEGAALGKAEEASSRLRKPRKDEVSGGVVRGRSYPRRFDKSLVGEATERRICELAMLDYCCLNFPLPSVCAGGKGDGEIERRSLVCKMDYDDARGKFRIQPGMFPEKGK